MMSGRTRVRAYHSFSLLRAGLRSVWEMLWVYDVMLSTSPSIVTFGWASTGLAIAIATTTARRRTSTIPLMCAFPCRVGDVQTHHGELRRRDEGERPSEGLVV